MEQNTQKKSWSPFCEFVLASYSRAWGLLWSVVNKPLAFHWGKKRDFSFPSRYQLKIASWLGVGLCVYFPECWYFVWFKHV